mmetsp:Transcript_38822/g.82503  ORF Transcript_38822/g.82503 Transcript_38822/m.82503 type:complete len:88 (-) Transcript_38822:89-352(-)
MGCQNWLFGLDSCCVDRAFDQFVCWRGWSASTKSALGDQQLREEDHERDCQHHLHHWKNTENGGVRAGRSRFKIQKSVTGPAASLRS